MPYQSGGDRRNNVQLGVGRSLWAGNPQVAIPERILDGIPGFFTWMALLLSIAVAVAFPRQMLLVAAFVGFYTALRFVIGGFSIFAGQRKINAWEKTDWRTRYRELAHAGVLRWDDVKHVVIIPNYKEPLDILRHTLDTLSKQYEATQRITIVLAMEAAEENCTEKAECLLSEYRDKFAHIYYTVHPRGLPGEMQCKSANQAWAARWIKRKLVDELDYNIDHMLVTTMDADTLWHPQYFYALTCLFAVNAERHYRFWQAPIRYHGNVWEINPLMRLLNAYSSGFELAHLGNPYWRPMPMSSYSLSLKMLDTCGYWDSDVIADEWHMFIKSYFARDGKIKLERVFLPFHAQATTGKNFLDASNNRYQQTLRHAWGSKEVGYMIAKMLEHPELEFLPSLRLLMRISHDILLAGSGWMIVTAGSQLPILFNPQIVNEMISQGFGNPTWALLQISFIMVGIMGFVFWLHDLQVRPPRNKPRTFKEIALTLIGFPLLPVLTLLFVAIPTIVAQTRLLIGIPLQFRVTKKV